MSHAVSILRRAQRELEDLPQDVYRRVAVALRDLAENPRPPGCQKLSGRDAWRVRLAWGASMGTCPGMRMSRVPGT